MNTCAVRRIRCVADTHGSNTSWSATVWAPRGPPLPGSGQGNDAGRPVEDLRPTARGTIVPLTGGAVASGAITPRIAPLAKRFTIPAPRTARIPRAMTSTLRTRCAAMMWCGPPARDAHRDGLAVHGIVGDDAISPLRCTPIACPRVHGRVEGTYAALQGPHSTASSPFSGCHSPATDPSHPPPRPGPLMFVAGRSWCGRPPPHRPPRCLPAADRILPRPPLRPSPGKVEPGGVGSGHRPSQ